MRLFSKLSCIILATFLLILPFFGCDTTIDTNDPTDDVGKNPTIHDKYINDISALENVPSVKSLLVMLYLDHSGVPNEFLHLLGLDKAYTAENADVLGNVDYLSIPIAQLKAFASGEGRTLYLYESPNP